MKLELGYALIVKANICNAYSTSGCQETKSKTVTGPLHFIKYSYLLVIALHEMLIISNWFLREGRWATFRLIFAPTLFKQKLIQILFVQLLTALF